MLTKIWCKRYLSANKKFWSSTQISESIFSTTIFQAISCYPVTFTGILNSSNIVLDINATLPSLLAILNVTFEVDLYEMTTALTAIKKRYKLHIQHSLSSPLTIDWDRSEERIRVFIFKSMAIVWYTILHHLIPHNIKNYSLICSNIVIF